MKFVICVAGGRVLGMGDESPFQETVLKGKVALIMGGGSGICFEIASQFGKSVWVRVAIMGRQKQVLETAAQWRRPEALAFRYHYIQWPVQSHKQQA